MLFSTHINFLLTDCFAESRFSDVTLVSDEQTPFQAHKFVLSSCSPVLKEIILKHPHDHPIIYLRDVSDQALHSILSFIYHGKVVIQQNDIDRVLRLAKDLKIEQFTEAILNSLSEKAYASENNSQKENNSRFQHKVKEEVVEHPGNIKTKLGMIGWSMAMSENDSQRIFKCRECGLVFKYRRGLWQHVKGKHKGFIYACTHCDYSSAQQGALNKHFESIHMGIKFSCDQPDCDYMASSKGSLWTHKKAMHEGFKYFCDQCDYQTGWKSDLNKHKKMKHSL